MDDVKWNVAAAIGWLVLPVVWFVRASTAEARWEAALVGLVATLTAVMHGRRARRKLRRWQAEADRVAEELDRPAG